MPDTLTPIDAATSAASAPTDLAEALWQISRTAHAAFSARADETEQTDPRWEGPEFAALSATITQAENALIDLRTTSPLAILRKLELMFEFHNWKLRDLDDFERRVVGGIITDLRQQLGHPAHGTDNITVTHQWTGADTGWAPKEGAPQD